MTISALELYKKLPRTNCGDCGVPTCLAFATKVVVEGATLGACPYLSPEALALADQIANQQQQGVGRKRDQLAIALKHLQEKVAPLDLEAQAARLGAEFGQENGRPYLRLPYFGHPVQVFKDEIRYAPAAAPNPWDAILLYNYIASQGSRPPQGSWIKFESLPNSISKAKTLHRLERDLAAAFSGRVPTLRQRAAVLGATPVQFSDQADLQVIFTPLPRLPVLLIFREAEPEEGFAAQAEFLFDTGVMDYLDLESLLFLVERLIDHLQAEPEKVSQHAGN